MPLPNSFHSHFMYSPLPDDLTSCFLLLTSWKLFCLPSSMESPRIQTAASSPTTSTINMWIVVTNFYSIITRRKQHCRCSGLSSLLGQNLKSARSLIEALCGDGWKCLGLSTWYVRSHFSIRMNVCAAKRSCAWNPSNYPTSGVHYSGVLIFSNFNTKMRIKREGSRKAFLVSFQSIDSIVQKGHHRSTPGNGNSPPHEGLAALPRECKKSI